MTDQDIPTIASVKQSMQCHIYDLSSSLAMARAATEGRLPEAYTDQEEAVNLMIRQAHLFAGKLVSELEHMDVLEGMERFQTQEAAASDAAGSSKSREISDVMGFLYEARSILQLIADREGPKRDDVGYVTYESAAGTAADIILKQINKLDQIDLHEARRAQS